MRILPPGTFPARDEGALRAFLEMARAEARQDGRERLASITLAVRHLDPLAVVESTVQPGDRYFYWEHPGRELALAGLEPLAESQASGSQRFADLHRWAISWRDRTILTGDVDAPMAGPRFCAAFTFADAAEPGSPFAPAQVSIPRWQVARCGENYSATANALVQADSDTASMAQRIWAAHRKFAAYDYSGGGTAVDGGEAGTNRTGFDPAAEEPDRERFLAAVREALRRIDQGRYEKIVLSRLRRLVYERPPEPFVAVNRLRNRFDRCVTFALGWHPETVFLGASPESLLRLEGGSIETEALAGSTARGQRAGFDARLADVMMQSRKETHEHALVADSILRRLSSLGLHPHPAGPPELLRLPNVQHLRTRIAARTPEGFHILQAAAVLHPTPAVGGTPREPAVSEIRDLEGHPRGLYTGAIGWFDLAGQGELTVALRCALLQGRQATAYAGAGLVAGSVPEQEWEETQLKLTALTGILF